MRIIRSIMKYTRGLTTRGDAILISVIFSLASCTRRLTRRDANGENSGMLPKASNSSSDIDLHIPSWTVCTSNKIKTITKKYI